MKYPINPMPKPRMTRADKWKQRPAVMKYRAYKDEIRLRGVSVPEASAHITFVIPMPASWSKKKRQSMNGMPHRQRPDIDNLHKGLLDALFTEDCQVWDHWITKVWGEHGAIIIEPISKRAAA